MAPTQALCVEILELCVCVCELYSFKHPKSLPRPLKESRGALGQERAQERAEQTCRQASKQTSKQADKHLGGIKSEPCRGLLNNEYCQATGTGPGIGDWDWGLVTGDWGWGYGLGMGLGNRMYPQSQDMTV